MLEAAWFTQLQKLFHQDKTGKHLAVKTLADIYALRIQNQQQQYDTEHLNNTEAQERRREIQEILDQLQQAQPIQTGSSQEGDDSDDESEGQAQSQAGGEEGGNNSQPQQAQGKRRAA